MALEPLGILGLEEEPLPGVLLKAGAHTVLQAGYWPPAFGIMH